MLVELCDVNGKQVKKFMLENSNSIEINSSDLAEGVYVVKVKTESYSTQKKAIIIR
jgi:Secretion system C-terminal sorting domain